MIYKCKFKVSKSKRLMTVEREVKKRYKNEKLYFKIEFHTKLFIFLKNKLFYANILSDFLPEWLMWFFDAYFKHLSTELFIKILNHFNNYML